MKYGFIGCGNMGGALAKAAAAAVGGGQLLLTDADASKAEALAKALGAQAVALEQLAAECDYIIMGVKPQGMEAALKAQAAVQKKAAVMVSMAAGLSLDRLAEMLPRKASWIRMMPNTPVQVGEGRILYTARAEQSEIAGFCRLFEKAGKLYPIEERLMDAGSALSGCGPAFTYLFIEALADGGVACGLPRALAMELAAGTVLGSAATVLQSGRHPGDLKDAVCSPGGSTIEGVKALEENAFRAAAMEAVARAYERTKELGNK